MPTPGQPQAGHTPGRRHWLAKTGARLLLAAGAGALLGRPAWALQPPTGKVLLRLSGRITRPNLGKEAHFDLAMLEALPRHEITTRSPWYPEPHRFTGVLLRDLVDAVGGQGERLLAGALNNYRVEIPMQDARDHPVVVAYRLDGKLLRVRSKGPLLVMYPYDANASLRNAVHFGRAIWQLDSLDIR